MRVALWSLVVVGAVLAGLGVVAAVLVGPDDVVSLPARPVPEKAVVAYSSPHLFAYRDLTLDVTVHGEGQVFVGTADPVDAASYLEGTRAYRFSGFGISGAIDHGATDEGGRAVPALAPAAADFWRHRATGAGTARLEASLGGDPVTVLVGPAQGDLDGPLRVSFGMRLRGAFATALVVVVVGLVVLLLGVRVIRARRRAAVAAGLAGALLLGGCGWVPSAGDHEREPVKTPIATRAELQAVLDDYSRRENAATRRRAGRVDPVLRGRPLTGAALETGRFAARYDRARGRRADTAAYRVTGLDVYSPELTSYPLYALATARATRVGRRGAGPSSPRYVTVGLLERPTVTSRWSLASTIAVPTAQLPTALRPGRSSTVSAAALRSARRLPGLIASFARTGVRSERLDAGSDLPSFRRQWAADSESATVSLTLRPYRATGERSGVPGPAVFPVRVRGGMLVLVQHDFDQLSRPRPPETQLEWTQPAYAAALGMRGDYSVLSVSGVLTSLVLVPDGGTPRVLGAAWGETGP